jgi:hypothetical protein
MKVNPDVIRVRIHDSSLNRLSLVRIALILIILVAVSYSLRVYPVIEGMQHGQTSYPMGLAIW